MNNLFFTISIILLAAWLIGFLGFEEQIGSLVHIWLLISIISFLIGAIRK